MNRSPTWSSCGRGRTSTPLVFQAPTTFSSSSRSPTPRSSTDRDVKARVYAAAGITEYWLTDLNANAVWRYSSPARGSFRSVDPWHRGQTIAPQLLPSCAIAVDVLLTE